VLQQAAGGPLAAVDWAPIMFWTIGGCIVASIVVSIVWGILAAIVGGIARVVAYRRGL